MAINKEMTAQPVAYRKHKSAVREWFDSILFAVIAATLIRWLFFEAFTIPTPSMENSLLVGIFFLSVSCITAHVHQKHHYRYH